jgi:hypothetical protein
MTKNRFGVATIALATMLGACTTELSEADQDVGAVGLTTDMATYSVGQTVSVTFTNMPGATTDWIALARIVDGNQAYEAWAYTGGGNTGTVVFSGSNLPQDAGTYEARAYFDWAGTMDYTIQGRSSSFTIGAAISTDATSYSSGSPVVVTYNGLPGTSPDWIAVAPSGSPVTTFTRWTYTNGQPSGQVTFADVPDGTYVARSFGNDSFTLAAESPSFVVGSAVTLTTSQPVYMPTNTITANWTGLTSDATNWLTVVPQGSPLTTYDEWHYTNGATSGSMQFAPIVTPGVYEVRAFYRDGFTLAKATTFTIANGPTVQTAGAYNAGDVVTVTFLDMPGNYHDWISVSQAGSPATSFDAWSYTLGNVNGTRDFAALPPGNYEARAYLNDTYTILATSPFTIANGASVMTDNSTYTAPATVTVTWSGLPGSVTDWIDLSIAGSPDTSYTFWVYTNGAKAGSTQFTNVPAGTYEARAYASNSFNVVARSASFGVQ